MEPKQEQQQQIKRFKILPKQLQFIQSSKKEVLYSGAYRSGKTIALLLKLYTHAAIPNNLCLLARKNRSSLTSTTLRTLLVGDGDLPPILQEGTYEHLPSKSIINIAGGGSIFYTGFDQELKLRGLTLGFAAVDEAIEINNDEYKTILSRLSSACDPNRQIALATNPSSKSHFLYKHFFESKSPNREVVNSPFIEDGEIANYYLPNAREYLDSLDFKGVERRRYIEAEWCNNSGCIFKEFNATIHAQIKELIPQKYFLGIDIGYTQDPTAILLIAQDATGTMYVQDEFYQTQIMPSEIVAKIKEYNDLYNPTIFIDPSSSGIRLELEKLGMNVPKTTNAVEEGILRVKDQIKANKLFVNPCCTNTIREFDLYSYKNDTDVPEGKNDHTMDALRYVCTGVISGAKKFIHPSLYVSQEDKTEIVEGFYDPMGEIE